MGSLKTTGVFILVFGWWMGSTAQTPQWWKVQSPASTDLYAITIDAGGGILGGGRPTTLAILHPQMGWLLQAIPDDSSLFTGVARPSSQTLIAVGRHRIIGGAGVYVISTDGGATWSVDTTIPDLFDVHFPAPTVGYRCGEAGLVHKTTDGGLTWQDVSIPTGQDIFAIFFIHPDTGWAVGTVDSQAVIFYTPDGGQTWIRQFSGVVQPLYDIHCVDANTCWAVGDGGTILATSDGGNTWAVRNSGTTQALFAVHFVNPVHGWIAGAGGTILHSLDSGMTWTPQTSPVQEDLFDVFMTSVSEGWIVGGSGTLLYYGVDTPTYSPSGIRFQEHPRNVSEFPFDLQIVPSGDGFWLVLTPETPEQLTSFFSLPFSVFVTSAEGRILVQHSCFTFPCYVPLSASTTGGGNRTHLYFLYTPAGGIPFLLLPARF